VPIYTAEDFDDNPQDRAERQAARQHAAHMRALTEELDGYEPVRYSTVLEQRRAAAKWDTGRAGP
jgi:hypothetical protein